MQSGGRTGRHAEPFGHMLDGPAISCTLAPRGDVVITAADADLRQRAWDAAATVVDPEIPVLTIADLGVLRDVAVTDGGVEVAITPTYSGCPAMNMIALEVELALARAGIEGAKVRQVMTPAWTTEWMTEAGRRKLARIRHRPAAPHHLPPRAVRELARSSPARIAAPPTPRSYREFGSTACKVAVAMPRAAPSRSTCSSATRQTVSQPGAFECIASQSAFTRSASPRSGAKPRMR